MNVLTRGLPMTGVALLMTSTGAFADVTAQQVWDDWRSGTENIGQLKMTVGSEDYANGVLTVTDLSINMVDDEGEFRTNLPELLFTEQSDGSVAITMSPEQTMMFSGVEDGGAGSFVAHLVVEQTDGVTIASGAPGAMNYEMSIPSVSLRLDQLELDGEVVDADAGFIMSNFAGHMSWGPNDNLFDIVYGATADRADMKFTMSEPGGSGSLTMNGSYEGLQTDATIAYPPGTDPEDADELFAAGLAVEWAVQLGATNMAFDFSDDEETAQWSMQLGGASQHAAVDQASFMYDTTMRDFVFNLTTSEMPFPIGMSAGEFGFGLSMPMSASPTPVPFDGRIFMTDISVDDDLWDMVDAGRVIPRDPATIAADISGTATLTRNLYDESGDDFSDMEPPGDLNSLEINTVDLAFGGATVHADGAFTFDNSDLETFDGMPRPEGQITAAISGVNGLMQKLGQIGLLQPEQAMGVTMMLGMFAVPSGDDAMTSTIAIDGAGKITANGMPLPF